MTDLFFLIRSWQILLDLFLGFVFQSFDFNATTGIVVCPLHLLMVGESTDRGGVLDLG